MRLNRAFKYDYKNDVEIDLRPLGAAIPTWASPEKIEVDMKRISEICRLARVDSLKVLATEEEGPKKIQIQSRLGTSATGEVSQEPAQHNTRSNERYGWLETRTLFDEAATHFTTEQIGINFAEIMEAGQLRDPKTWAEFIDQALRAELWKIAKRKHRITIKKIITDTIGATSLAMIQYLTAFGPDRTKNHKIAALIDIGFIYGAFQTSTALGLSLTYCLSRVILHQMRQILSEELANNIGIRIKYDPATELTAFQFEWDRLLMHRKTLKERIVKVCE